MRVLEDMKELLEDQLKKINKKGDAISPQELDNAYKAVDIIKDIATIEAMMRAEKEEEMMKSQEGGYSMHYPMPRRYPDMMMPPEEGYARNAYDGGRSYAGGSYAGGGQSRDGGSSNADGQGRRDAQSNAMGMGPEYSEEYSERRGRSRRTGRYVSRDGGSYDGSYDGSYEYYSRDEAQDKEKLKKQIQEMQQKLNNM